ncbi:VWA domain-containing protein [Microbacterium gorillae]|uniref:VWA domain-containing protein n=1 Tax=Microbacterium gorillae TaxID=1231063 RepID=UPI000A4E3E95|nr:VWA domain-containing protein [Microbacterium gorillae]
MALANGWLFFVAAAVLVLAVVIGLLLGRRRRPGTADAGAPLARAERVRALPSFAHAIRARRIALSGVLAIGAVAVLVGGVAAARPMTSQTIQPVSSSRDIMLCLDVSGSMTDVDTEVIDVFTELLAGFHGERIGLTIFNGSPVQVFPLTDDYAFVKERLADIKKSFDYTDSIPEHWAGTLNGNGASLVGDGLAACAMRFDHLDTKRSRTIVLATDNELNGSPILTLPEAAQYAASKKVRVFAIDPVAGMDAALTNELAQAAESTGGRMYELRDSTSVSDIITEVQKEQATQLKGQVRVVWSDAPDLILLLLAAGVVAFVALMWRVRL